jgi:adenylosuccinate synthase
MDGLETVKICTAYQYNGEEIDLPPYGADGMSACKPIYEEMPGWKETTHGIRKYDEIPENARVYLDRISELLGLPVHIISTGADRDDTIVLEHPFTGMPGKAGITQGTSD